MLPSLGRKMLLNQTHRLYCLVQIVVLSPILFFINVLNKLCIVKRPPYTISVCSPKFVARVVLNRNTV